MLAGPLGGASGASGRSRVCWLSPWEGPAAQGEERGWLSGAAVTFDSASLHLTPRASPYGKIKRKASLCEQKRAPNGCLPLDFSALLIASGENLCYTKLIYLLILHGLGWDGVK